MLSIIDKYEMGDDSGGRRRVPFDCYNEIEQYKCKICPSFRTCFLASLKRHRRNYHRSEDSDQIVYKCLKCFFVTCSKYLFGRHSYFSECATRDVNERNERFVQYQSDQSNLILKNEIHQFESELALTRSNGKSSVKSHECTQCGSKFASQSMLAHHVKLCHSKLTNSQLFACRRCSTRFTRKASVRRHMRTQNCGSQHCKDVQWFKCDKCQSEFQSRSGFRIHDMSCRRKSEDIQWFSCNQCSAKFKLNSHLKTHILCVHTKLEDIQWLKCEQCSTKFKHGSSLKHHLMSRRCNRLTGHNSSESKQKGNLKTHIQLRALKILSGCLVTNVQQNSNEIRLKTQIHAKPEDII